MSSRWLAFPPGCSQRGARWPKRGSTGPQDAQRRLLEGFQTVPRWSQNGWKTSTETSKTAQGGQKMPQDDSERPQDGFKTFPKGTQDGSTAAPKHVETAPRNIPLAPRLQDSPRKAGGSQEGHD